MNNRLHFEYVEGYLAGLYKETPLTSQYLIENAYCIRDYINGYISGILERVRNA